MTSWINTPPFGDEPLTEAEGGNELVIGPDEVAGPRFGPLLPLIVHPGHRDALILVDPGTGEELHLTAGSARALLDAIRSTGTMFPGIREIPGFVDRALHA